MSVILKLKRNGTSNEVPTTTHIVDGEPCINTADKKLYVRMGSDIVTFVPETKHTWNETTDPSSGDDGVDGFIPSSMWYNATLSSLWVCVDNTVGSAVWEQLS